MSERISDDRLAELAERLATNFECWIFSDVKRAEAVELVANAFLERRKAEQCQKCEGLGILHYGNPPEQRCPECNGTGRKSALTAIYEIATRELAEPGDRTGLLVSICTLIEEGFTPTTDVERKKEWREWNEVLGWIPLPAIIMPDSPRRKQWRYAAGEWKDL